MIGPASTTTATRPTGCDASRAKHAPRSRTSSPVRLSTVGITFSLAGAAPLIPPPHAGLRVPRCPLRHVVPESIEAGRLLRTSRAPHGIDVVQAVAIDAPAPVASTAKQLQLVFGVLDDHEFAGTAAGTAVRHRVQVLFTPAGVE